MSHLSRRSVAKGAAWTVPVVSIASVAAPAYASSTQAPNTCVVTNTSNASATPLIRDEAQSSTSAGITGIVAGDGTYPGGSYISITGLVFQVPTNVTITQTCTDASGNPTTTTSAPTGFYMYAGTGADCSQFLAGDTTGTTTTHSGSTYDAKVTLNSPSACSPQVAGSGVATNIGVQTAIPYNALVCFNDRVPQSITIPVSVVYLNGLDPQQSTFATSVTMHYDLTMTFASGCQTNRNLSYSWTPRSA